MRHYGSAVAGLALLAAMSAGAAVVPTQSGRSNSRDPQPSNKPKKEKVTPEPVAEVEVDPVTPPNDGEGIPNRLCIQRDSPYYTSAGVYVGVIFNGQEVSGRVVEFNRAMGWVRLANVQPGEAVGQHEARTAPQSFGKVEPYWREQPSRQIRRQLARIA